jgi:hypothetical protein
VTDPDVTETGEASAEKHKADRSAEEKTATVSERALAEFTFAAKTYLPRMTEADRRKAYELVAELTNDKAEAA